MVATFGLGFELRSKGLNYALPWVLSPLELGRRCSSWGQEMSGCQETDLQVSGAPRKDVGRDLQHNQISRRH